MYRPSSRRRRPTLYPRLLCACEGFVHDRRVRSVITRFIHPSVRPVCPSSRTVAAVLLRARPRGLQSRSLICRLTIRNEYANSRTGVLPRRRALALPGPGTERKGRRDRSIGRISKHSRGINTAALDSCRGFAPTIVAPRAVARCCLMSKRSPI